MHPLTRSLLSIILVILLAVVAQAGPAPEPIALDAVRRKALDEAMAAILMAGKTPGFQVAVVENGEIVYSRAVGLADVATKTPATPETRYRIASISKMFTAVAVMQQVAKKTVDLDAPVARYLPWAPHADKITVIQLLQHRSGLPDFGDRAIADGSANKSVTPRGIVAYAGATLDFEPGTAYEYSNTNYVLLGQIVEKVSGASLGDYLKKAVFEPAKMTHTTFSAPPAGAPFATGYDMSSGKPVAVPTLDPSWFYGCGSIVSTADDLARFDIALTNGTLLPVPSFAEMSRKSVATLTPERMDYGLGLQIFHLVNLTLVGHHGGLPGYETDDTMVAGDHFALVVLSNSFQFPTSSWMRPALDTFYPSVVAAARAHPRSPPADPSPARTAVITAFLTTLASGTIDDARLAASLREALTLPQRLALAAQFKLLGAPRKVIWLGAQRFGKIVRHTYRVDFASKTVTLLFVVDPDGKLSGFFFG